MNFFKMCVSSIKNFSLIVVISITFATEVHSQDASDEQLMQWTSSVGQMLHSYHSAYNIAVRTIHQNTGAEEIPLVYAGGPYDDGWAFSFGEIENSGEFVLTYGVIVNANGEVLNFDHFEYRRVASPHHTSAAKALLEIKSDFEELRSENDQFEAEIFRYAVLPFPRDHLTAFVSPKQMCDDFTLVGNDIMYTLTRNEAEIIRRTRFIHSLIQFPFERPENFVTVALKVPENPMPSPIDVMTAMERDEKVAVYAKMGVFMIERDGTIEKLSEDDPLVKDLWE